MKLIVKDRKFLIGLAVSLVLAMAVGSFALGEAQTPVTPQAAEPQVAATNDGDTGAFNVEGGTYGETADYHFESTTDPDSGNVDRVLYIHPQDAETEITISTNGSTTDRIEVTSAATIILAGVEIDSSSITATEEPAALTITDDATFNVNIFLKDDTENILKGATGDIQSGIIGSPGIQKNGDTDVGMLTITGSTGEDAGKLEATGGVAAAGIGGGAGGSGSYITIEGGTVTATAGFGGAGIGGGSQASGSDITITGGTVTATGGDYASGIGGGYGGNGSNITITGGKVEAYAGDLNIHTLADPTFGAGIGGGAAGNGTGITISGGEVIATGKNGGAGIGGGCMGAGTDITISGGNITATGGYIEGSPKGSGAGIGSGARGTASGNKLNGNAVVLATSGEDDFVTSGVKPQLDGFVDDQGESMITQGIVFTGVGYYEFVPIPDPVDPDDGTWVLKSTDWIEGTQYGNVTLTEDTTFPVDFTIESNAALTIGKNSEDKEARLSMAEGKTLTVKGSLVNEGIIDIPAENLKGNGEIKTLLNYDPQGGEIVTNDDEYITYQNASGVQTYGTMPDAERDGYSLDGWYTEKEGKGTEVLGTDNVLLNQHTLYANWVEPGPEPTPTPPGPEPTPTPEPTPDPSVDPNGGNGNSSKTSDPFMGGIALALLGVATTGAILTRKFR